MLVKRPNPIKTKKEIAIGIVILLLSGTLLSLLTFSCNIQDQPFETVTINSPDTDIVQPYDGNENLEPVVPKEETSFDSEEPLSQRGAETSVVRTAIRKALDYLITTQSSDGGWETYNYGKAAAMAGFGMRAFLDYQAMGESEYVEPLQKAIQFLKDVSHDPEGYPPGAEQDYWGGLIHNDMYNPTEASVKLYSHGAATIALIDYYWATKDPEILILVQNAVDLIFRAQHTEYRPATLGGPVDPSNTYYGGWRYTPDFSSCDMSLTGWQFLALISAREIGINIPDSSINAAKQFIHKCFNDDGSVSYTPGGAKASDLTAIGVFCLLLMGENATSDPYLEAGLNYLRERPPIWEIENPPEHVAMPFYYWYYATQVWYQIGEKDWIWWNSSVTDMLISRQNEDGSWDAAQFEGDNLGMDFTTALAVLILQISRRGVYLKRWVDEETGVGDSLSKEVKLSGDLTYNLTVTSVGKGILIIEEDNITLTISDAPEGWNAYLETPTPNDGIINEDGEMVWWVFLSSLESANITLHVEAPDLGDIGDICYINVDAWSSENKLAMDSITTTSFLVIDLDFSLMYNLGVVTDVDSEHYGEKWMELAPGAKTVLGLTLKNLGELNDTFDLSIEGIRPGWETLFTENGLDTINVTLPFENYEFAENTMDLHISVKIPADAQAFEVAVIKIVGESQYSKQNPRIDILRREDMAIITTSETVGIAIGCEDPLKYLNPGGNATYNLTIWNLGNYQVNVVLSNSELTAGWKIEFTKSVEVYKEACARVPVKIRAPPEALAGSRIMVTITAVATGDTSEMVEYTEKVVLIAIVNMISDIYAYMSPASISTDPGGVVEYELNVENLGNGDDSILLLPQILDADWNMVFLLNGEEEYKTDLEYGENKTFTILIETSLDAEPGAHKLAINLSSTTQIIIMYSHVIINQIYEVSIRLYDENKEEYTDNLKQSTSPSQSLTFLLEVRNEGNGPDIVELTITGIKEDWDVYFNCITSTRAYSANIQYKDFTQLIDARYLTSNEKYLCQETTERADKLKIKLNKGQKIWASIIASGSKEPVETQNKFTIKAESEVGYRDDPDNNEVTFKITLLFPDLTFEGGITTSRQIKHGQLTSISVYIKNIGEFEANDFIITLQIDDRDVKSIQINRVAIKGDVIVHFTWQAVGGEHKVTVIIDPDNRIIEENDQFRGFENNNVATCKIDVESSGLLGARDTAKSICAAFMIIFIIVFFVLLLTYMKKQGWVKFRHKPKLKLKNKKN